MRWSSRIPNTLRAEIQVQNWINSLGCKSYSHATVLRLARIMELRGVAPEKVYWELRRDFPHFPDLNNRVIDTMKSRAYRRSREQELNPQPTHRLLLNGELEPIA